MSFPPSWDDERASLSIGIWGFFFLSCNFHTCHLRSFFIQVLNSTLVFSSLNAWFEIWYLGSSSNVVYVCNTRYIQLCKRRKTQSLLSESTIWNSYRSSTTLSPAPNVEMHVLPLQFRVNCLLYLPILYIHNFQITMNHLSRF